MPRTRHVKLQKYHVGSLTVEFVVVEQQSFEPAVEYQLRGNNPWSIKAEAGKKIDSA